MIKTTFKRASGPLTLLILAMALGTSPVTLACGGFFCDLVPIDQAGEQIVFKQDSGLTTAMIKIDYVGNAEDFGWVLPVPQTPDISLGSDQIFTDLELASRPQFLLTREGEPCFSDEAVADAVGGGAGGFQPTPPQPKAEDGVIIEQSVSVGPFDAQVVSSDNPEALALWLDDNNLDLTERGAELLAPYVNSQSKFVVLKLKNNASVGSIQPIILTYASDVPVIPMTLTAVAAQEDMGVLVWLIGDGRGVPKNFKHVTPNYARLNWFTGTRNAYASYQSLITEAMNDAGGQGFATDFAGYLPNLKERLSTATEWEKMLEVGQAPSDASFISMIWTDIGSETVQTTIRSALPTSDTFVYTAPLSMQEVFDAAHLASARTLVIEAIQQQLITPINNAVGLFDESAYITRLYTTLSADEMTTNPEFTFNTAMGPQPLTRQATLAQSCIDDKHHWTLTLGSGTDREGETVIEGWDVPPPFGQPALTGDDQVAMWRAHKTSANADPVLLAENVFPLMVLGEKFETSTPDTPKSKSGATGTLDLFALLALLSFTVGFSSRRLRSQSRQ